MNRWKRMYYFDANIFILPQIYDLSVGSAAKAKEYLRLAGTSLMGMRTEGKKKKKIL
jgi:hypothetical protein